MGQSQEHRRAGAGGGAGVRSALLPRVCVRLDSIPFPTEGLRLRFLFLFLPLPSLFPLDHSWG